MSKRLAQHVWRYVRKVHPLFFFGLSLVLAWVCVQQLKQNNLGMIARRDAVFRADKENGDVEGALRELRTYIYGHMNTSLTTGPNPVYPPIQLKYTYERKQAERQAQLGQNRSTLYHEAQQACDSQGRDLSVSDTVSCIENYAAERGVQLATIPDALYKFDFTSAKWTPDLAGWSLVGSVVSMLACILLVGIRFAAKRWLK